MRNTRHGKDFRRLAALLLSMALLLTDATLVNAAEAAVNAPAVSPEGTMVFSVPEDTGDGDQKETTDPSEQAVSPDGAEGEGQEGSAASPEPTETASPDGAEGGDQEGSTASPEPTETASPDGAEGEGQEGSTASPAPTDPSDPDTQDPAADGNGTDIPGSDTAFPSVSDGDAALPSVSDGDAALPGREPERFHEEAVPEDYGTLVSYDAYSRTYHVDGDSYITVIGNDGSTYIDEDGLLQSVDNRLVQEESALFSLMGAGSTAYRNSAGDYTVLFPGDMGTGGTDAGEAQTGTAGYGTPETGAGITILSGGHAMILYPAEGTFRDGLVRDNAIRYSNVFPDIDYQYTVLGDSVKEDIILLSRTSKNTFSYQIGRASCRERV